MRAERRHIRLKRGQSKFGGFLISLGPPGELNMANAKIRAIYPPPVYTMGRIAIIPTFLIVTGIPRHEWHNIDPYKGKYGGDIWYFFVSGFIYVGLSLTPFWMSPFSVGYFTIKTNTTTDINTGPRSMLPMLVEINGDNRRGFGGFLIYVII